MRSGRWIAERRKGKSVIEHETLMIIEEKDRYCSHSS